MADDAFNARKNRISRSGMKRLQASGDQARGSTAPNSLKTATGHHQRRTPSTRIAEGTVLLARIIEVPQLLSEASLREGGGTTMWRYTMREQRFVGPNPWNWEDVAEGSDRYEFTAYNLYELNNPTAATAGFSGDGRLSNGVLLESIPSTHSIQAIPAGNTHEVTARVAENGETFYFLSEPNGIDGVCSQSASSALQTQNLMEH